MPIDSGSINNNDIVVNKPIRQKPAGINGVIREKIYAQAKEIWGEQGAEDISWIIKKESGFNPSARNGNCLGLFQRNHDWSEEQIEIYLNKPEIQIEDGFKYIQDRYKTPQKAKEFWSSHRWY